ncbi:MAG: hypothetical protein IPJ40_14480 [Saprospirales bacterium]|nr:hypothetical protein [Saprospirales bacterium]
MDAGLQPRLAAAADPETGNLLFDVRYQRRDQDLGLVGTLADVLSYYTLTSVGPEEEGTQAEEDPNQEKIQAIEALAKELEADTASSFLNLIERYKAIGLTNPAQNTGITFTVPVIWTSLPGHNSGKPG